MNWNRYAVWVLLGTLAALGLWGRFAGLGDRPLAVDEYYFLVSIESILEDGVPDLPGGGIYDRGILIQYLTAGVIAVTGNTMLGLRLVPALFGLGCVALAFLYGAQVADRRVGMALAALVFISSWNVEFSRFGRMYSPFQFFTLLVFVGFVWTLTGKEGWRRYVAPLAVLLGIVTHELAMLLMPLLFVPLLVPGRSERFGGHRALALYGFTSAAVAALCLWQFFLWNRGGTGLQSAMPSDYMPGPPPPHQVGRWVVPAFPFWRIADGPLENLIGVILLMGLTAGILAAATRLRRGIGLAHALAGTALVAAAMHQLAVAGLLLAALAVRYRSRLFDPDLRSALHGAAGAGLIALSWLVYATVLTYIVGDRTWIARADENVFRWALYHTFFGWPDLYTPTVGPWIREIPGLSALLIPAVLAFAWGEGRRHLADFVRRPGFPVLYVAVLFGILAQQYHQTRYWFFVYPLVLALLLLAGRDAVGRMDLARTWAARWGTSAGALGLAAVMLLFTVTDDFNPLHLARVRSADVAYRTNEYAKFSEVWYPREDARSPSEFVNDRMRSRTANARVIVADVPQASYYLDDPHAVFYPRDHDRFSLGSRQRGTVDYYSGQRLLSTHEDLREYVRGSSHVWVLRRDRSTPVLDVDSVWGGQIESVEHVYAGPDGFLEVLLVNLREST